ncbi:hypothetical protein LSAT2_000972 [Lamellibrachia satsuma]|nr:hypothetical protein LSAT2_000972 [Lamellibrachia satsuma]
MTETPNECGELTSVPLGLRAIGCSPGGHFRPETAFSRLRAPPGYYTMTQKLFAMTALALLVCSVIVPEVTSTTWSQNMIICMEACTKASNECTAQCNTDGLGDDCINKRCVRGIRNCSEFCNYLYGAELMSWEQFEKLLHNSHPVKRLPKETD